MDELVVERVDLVALLVFLAQLKELLFVERVDFALLVQHLHEPVGVEQHLQDWAEELSQQADGRLAAAIQVVGVSDPLLRLKRVRLAVARTLELLDQIRANAFRIEKALELDVGQLLNLFFGVVDATFGLNPRPDLAHDLLDVDGISSYVEICHSCSTGV